MSETPNSRPNSESELIARVRAAARQEQFLDVLSADEARARFEQHLDLSPLGAERLSLGDALTRVLACDIVATVDAPPFDRSNVDGFALRAADTLGASQSGPKLLRLNAEVIACGDAPALEVTPGTATTIATGGVIPRGADAVVMVEHTELVETGEPHIELQRAAAPGQFISYAGSDIARGETLLQRGARIGSREIGMLAACGLASIDVVRRPKVAVISTGDELVALGEPLKPAGIYDSNGAIIAAAIILFALLEGEQRALSVLPARVLLGLIAIGPLLYGAVGVAGILLGGNFLDYSVLSSNPVKGQQLGILLIEAGVGITVTGVLLGIFHAFAARGR